MDILAPASLVKAIDAYGQPCDNNRGTSFAAPLVAGAAALWRQKLPEASPLELQNKLLENAGLERVNLPEPDRERLTRRFLDLSREP
ncbi:type VII secretion-associated serine protease mycosin [Calidithermus roseus]|uniref:Type VII secretion-associated serine protease mycosin n=1 Tax=Calidithermus roseus TaxID=1644118 RepID=A0A399EK52_9DEIN|nr:type VII secretion-associated serine protease mycosin [Calidithermus roseus]